MFTKKKILIIIISVLVLGSLGYFYAPKAADYYEWRQVVKAAGSMPWQDGGTIIMVREPCVLDTPAVSPTTCAISCPLVTGAVGTLCTGYIEIDTASQMGTTFIAAPVGFVYKGGGTHPAPGMQFIAGGVSNIQPWVIGIPGGI